MLQAQDRSISVRDAVLEFLGKLLSSPMEAEADTVELVDGVLARLKVCRVESLLAHCV